MKTYTPWLVTKLNPTVSGNGKKSCNVAFSENDAPILAIALDSKLVCNLYSSPHNSLKNFYFSILACILLVLQDIFYYP
jgi:hypothetical protein